MVPPSKWHLEDVEVAHKCNPVTFRIPTLEERNKVQPGSVVRLHFVTEKGQPIRAERKWVKVVTVCGNKFRGELLNEPARVPGLSKGDIVEFQARHIASILIGKDDPRWIDETKGAFVSNRVLEDGQPVRFLYREPPDCEEDSGWRMFAGDEDEKYVA